MKLGVDATAVSGSIVGHYSYVANMINEMLVNDMLKGHECIIYCRGKGSQTFQNIAHHDLIFKFCPLKNRKLCEQLWLSTVAPFDSLDVFHSTWSLPIIYPTRCVLTLHGLASYLYPKYFTKSYRLYWATTSKRNVTKATKYIAISSSTKQDFVEHMGISEEKIDVVYHGVDTIFFRRIQDPDRISQLRKQYSFPDRFILFVSALIPIKNLTTLIKAYHRLIQIPTFRNIGLVIAGGKSWGCEPVFETVERLNLRHKVIFTGYFPQEDLPTLYSAAELFVLPSFYEGFGIPVLESFACGTPVITSSTSSLPEVAGDAAVLVDPHEVDELTDAMETVLSNQALQKTLIQKGLERAKMFSWKKTAEETLKVYEKAINV